MTSKQLYLRLLRYVLPYKGIFALSIFGTVLLALSEPAIPALMKPLLDGSFVQKDPSYTHLMPILLVVIVLLRGIADYVGSVAMRWVSNRVVTDLRQEMFARILDLPACYFDQHPSGQTVSKVTYDVTRVMSASTDVLVVLIRDSLAIVGLLAWLFYLNWELTMVSLIVAPPTAFVIHVVSKRLRRLAKTLQNTMGQLTNIVQESTRGQRVVKVFGASQYEQKRFGKANNRVRQYNMKVATAAEINAPLVQLLAVIALAIVVYLASLQAQQNEMTVGEFVSLFTAMGMLFSPIKRLTKMNEKLQLGLAAAESIFHLIDEPPEQDTGTRQMTRARGELAFTNVSLSYSPEAGEVISDFSLRVDPGERIALVGRSGSGKTSVVNLVPRFYAPDAGFVAIDGINVQDILLSDLRANIAYVSQDTVLFNDTVAANIAYGEGESRDMERVRAAAARAYASRFIESLPQGFDTPIGEDGLRLSGGQRQRIAIARALYKDAPILILDEATSALDSESEQEIQKALEDLEKGRTSLIIAHRLSTIENADRIVVMEQGRIVESGNHADLIARDGAYADLYRLQREGIRRTSP